MRPHHLLLTVLLSFTFAGNVAAADIVTSDREDYQRSVEALTKAKQAVLRAMEYVEQSRQSHAIAGFNYRQLSGDLRAIDETLSRSLAPHEQSLKFTPVFPESSYFKPVSQSTGVETYRSPVSLDD